MKIIFALLCLCLAVCMLLVPVIEPFSDESDDDDDSDEPKHLDESNSRARYDVADKITSKK